MDEESEYVFELEPNEEYSERCGEVFLTNIGYLVFHCTLCDMKFKGFEKFADHERDEHLLSTHYSDSFLDAELGELDFDNDFYNNKYPDVEANELEAEIESENVDFEVLYNKEASSIMPLFSEAIDTQSIEDLESGIRTDEDYSPNINDHNDIEISEMDNFQEKLDETNNIPGIRPIRKATRSRIPAVERKHKCSICGSAFRDKHNLNHHMLRHTNEKKFPCDMCEKKFFTAAERRVHYRSHTQERPHLCCECGLRFSTNVLLVNHIKRHNNQPDHHCPHCEKSFFEKSSLRAHLYTHSGQKPYVCKICKTGYMHSRSLKNHMELHENM